MTQRSEQLVLDYLSEVGLALYGRMTAKERTAYLRRVRAKIDQRREAAEDDGVATVRNILRSFGTPEDLVERDCGGRNLDIEDDELIPPKPSHANRAPPPWRGGPNRGLMALLEGPSQTDMSLHGKKKTRRGGVLRGVAVTARTHPAEVAALGLLVLCVPWWWNLAFMWVLGAALIVLSQVWSARDKWIGVGAPLLGCGIGMLLWSGDAKFIDEYIQQSLSATGVIGLGLASLGCVVYLWPRVLRSAQSAEAASAG